MASSDMDTEPIRDIITTIARYLDNGTPDLLDNVLTSDAVLIPPFPFRPVKGLPAIKQKLRDMRLENEWWDPAGIRSIEVESSDIAKVISCCGATVACQTLVFEDDLVKGIKGWRIKERKIFLERGNSRAK